MRLALSLALLGGRVGPSDIEKVDSLFQFSYWETLTPSISGGYANDDYHDNQFGL